MAIELSPSARVVRHAVIKLFVPIAIELPPLATAFIHIAVEAPQMAWVNFPIAIE